MAKRKRKDESGRPAPPAAAALNADHTAASDRRAPARVLAVDPDTQAAAELERALTPLGLTVAWARNLSEARSHLARYGAELVLVDERLPDGHGLDLLRDLSAEEDAPVFVLMSESPALSGAVEAMRLGAVDFLPKPLAPADLGARVQAALEHAARRREEKRRVDRLKRMCKRLNSAREEVTKQVDSLCTDLVSAYQELADQVGTVGVASEFSALVRQELDVEALLRVTLEFLLARSGPTNAAIFLPTGHDDYNLGAYVNYDLPKETADVLLDHLADVLPPRFVEEPTVVRLADEPALRGRLGENAEWLIDSSLVVFSCRDDGDCLAVVALFRDRATPFTDELLGQLAVIRDIFGEQLGRVVRIHHRHMPEGGWPGFDVEDDRGMAA